MPVNKEEKRRWDVLIKNNITIRLEVRADVCVLPAPVYLTKIEIGEDLVESFWNPRSDFWTYENQRSLKLAQEISLKIKSYKKKELRIQSYVQ